MPALRSTPVRAVLTALLAALVLTGPGPVPPAGAGARAAPRTADVHVSPSGRDADDGTAAHPVRTLTRARDLAREKSAHYGSAHYSGDITVHLAPGTYRTTGPLVLDGRDSGPAGHSVVRQGAGADSTLISGGRGVEGWRQVSGRPGL